MERTRFAAHRWRLILFAAASLIAAVLLWDVIRALAMQLLAAALLMLLALPLCRHLERRMPGGVAAAVSLVIAPAASNFTLAGMLSMMQDWITPASSTETATTVTSYLASPFASAVALLLSEMLVETDRPVFSAPSAAGAAGASVATGSGVGAVVGQVQLTL